MKTIKTISTTILAFFCLSVNAQTVKDAMKYMDNEQYEKAASVLKKVIAAEANNGDNYFWFGENYFKTDDQDSAKMMYDAGLKKNPSNALCMVGVGKVLWFQGKSEEAKKMFYSAGVVLGDKSMKMTNQQKAMVCLKIAEAYITAPTKDLAEANTQIQKAATYDQNNSMVKILMGDLLYEKAAPSDAINEYKKAEAMDKTSPMPNFKKGVLYVKANNPEAAQNELDLALKIDSMFAPAYRVKAEAFYYRNQMDKAINAYKKYLSINSGNASARLRYASFLFVAKKYTDCIAECKQLQKDASKSNLLNRLLGYSYFETGDYPNGLASMDAFFAKQPENKILATDYEYYGRLQSKSGKDSVAVIWYKKALMKDSTHTDLYTEIGAIYKKAKKYPEAIDAYSKKIAKGGKNVNVNDYYFLGQCYFYSKDYVKADTAFAQYCKVQKDIYLGYMWRGRCNAAIDSLSKTFQAHPFYEQVILKSKPTDPAKDLEEAYYYMGLYYVKATKDFGYAKCCFQKVVDMKINPDDKKSRYSVSKNSLDLPELKNATVAEKCIKE